MRSYTFHPDDTVEVRTLELSEPTLAALRETAAHEDRNLMPGLLDAARAHATEGEIIEALQTVFGAYTETPVF